MSRPELIEDEINYMNSMGIDGNYQFDLFPHPAPNYVLNKAVSTFGKKKVSKKKKMAFGKKKSVKKVLRKRPSKALIKKAKKLHIKVTKKVGKKRVYKRVSVIKKQIKLKLKKHKTPKRTKFGSKLQPLFEIFGPFMQSAY